MNKFYFEGLSMVNEANWIMRFPKCNGGNEGNITRRMGAKHESQGQNLKGRLYTIYTRGRTSKRRAKTKSKIK